ncbi:MAG: hypothetical protein P4L35_18295 [Ignavibacteriaceae bacterium]|nr:hypothetical protein [Ignavibacteriaceae bacterium]
MFKSAFLLVIIISSITAVNAQQLSNRQLDSLYYSIVRIKRPDLLRNIIRTFNVDTTHKKSCTSLFIAVKFQLQNFNKQQRSILQSILDRPATDTSFVTPNGFFRIHYDTAGVEMTTYNLQLFADALDSVYNFEINYLGYPPPPPDSSAGGDDKYDVYLTNAGGDYGYTVPETEIVPGSGRFTAYTVISNDFTGFYTTGINAARVTAAHEFEHAINIGNYINRYFSGDEFFYELSATAMEHFVFGTIKDYIQYLPAYFSNTQNSMAVTGTIEEFALGIWNIHQKDRFGFDILKKEWELMPQMRAMDAINYEIQQYGSSLGAELNNFALWMYFTNYRAIPGKYFEDAPYYPLVVPVSTVNFNSGESFQLSTGPASNIYISIVNQVSADTLVLIFTNSDVQDAIDSTNSLFPFSFSLYDRPMNGAIEIVKNYYINFSADKKAFWTTGEILNNSTIQSGQSLAGQINYPFPSPFIYDKNVKLYIPVNQFISNGMQFNVYTVAMKLVYSSNMNLSYYNGQKVITWDGKNSFSNKLSTGVYIYIIKSGDNLNTGKLVIINQ